MKTPFIRSLILTMALASCVFATDSFRPFVLNLAPGSSPDTVRKTLGVPSATMGKDLWVYFEFAKPNPNVANPEFDTLVVAFTDSRVTAVKITDGRVVRRLLAQYKVQSAPDMVAGK
jgi:hypothetical protein